MLVTKCAWCGAVIETKGDASAEGDEISHSLCRVCEIEIKESEETDLIITVDESQSP